jgi:hypothetical protein
MSDLPQRRADDHRIEQLQKDLVEMKATVTEVREILASFRIALKLAKGCGVIAAAATAVVTFVMTIKGGVGAR